MADATLWISIACILTVFDIRPGKDENGNPVEVKADFESGMIWYVAVRQCENGPRSIELVNPVTPNLFHIPFLLAPKRRQQSSRRPLFSRNCSALCRTLKTCCLQFISRARLSFL